MYVPDWSHPKLFYYHHCVIKNLKSQVDNQGNIDRFRMVACDTFLTLILKGIPWMSIGKEKEVSILVGIVPLKYTNKSPPRPLTLSLRLW